MSAPATAARKPLTWEREAELARHPAGQPEQQPVDHPGYAGYPGGDAAASFRLGAATHTEKILSVGLAGLEPATSCTQSTRASQTALQPVAQRV